MSPGFLCVAVEEKTQLKSIKRDISQKSSTVFD